VDAAQCCLAACVLCFACCVLATGDSSLSMSGVEYFRTGEVLRTVGELSPYFPGLHHTITAVHELDGAGIPLRSFVSQGCCSNGKHNSRERGRSLFLRRALSQPPGERFGWRPDLQDLPVQRAVGAIHWRPCPWFLEKKEKPFDLSFLSCRKPGSPAVSSAHIPQHTLAQQRAHFPLDPPSSSPTPWPQAWVRSRCPASRATSLSCLSKKASPTRDKAGKESPATDVFVD